MATTRTDGERIPLMLIHGAWLSARSWENFAECIAFEGRPHLFMVSEGGDEVAAAIDSWLDGVLEAPEAAR